MPECQYRKMDIFALTSDTEQMPLGILEAMASGLPIISLAVGDVMDMVSEQNRPFVVRRDAEPELLNRLLSLVDNPDLRGTLGRANRNTATARFDHQTMVARYAELFG